MLQNLGLTYCLQMTIVDSFHLCPKTLHQDHHHLHPQRVILKEQRAEVKE
jgi:hypothetical protein